MTLNSHSHFNPRSDLYVDSLMQRLKPFFSNTTGPIPPSATNHSSTSHKIPITLWNPMVDQCSQQPYNGPCPWPDTSCPSCHILCLTIYCFNVILPPMPRSSMQSLYFLCAHQNPAWSSLLSHAATCPSHPICVDLLLASLRHKCH